MIILSQYAREVSRMKTATLRMDLEHFTSAALSKVTFPSL